MVTIIAILATLIILGAIFGGKTFGGTVKRGCGVSMILIILFIILITVAVYFITQEIH